MRAVSAVIRPAPAAWRGRFPGPEPAVYASWADVPPGCNCRYLAGAAGWAMELCRLNCPEIAVHRGYAP